MKLDCLKVIIDVNLKEFSNDATLDSIITKFDMNVSGNPTLSSRLECLISDYGLLEQLKVTCLELHHNHLLCRRCNFAYSDDKLALSFEDISHLLSLERLNRDNIMIITNSILIKESLEYQQYLKTFVSAFVPQKTIEFIFCSSSNCGIGAALSAATSLYFNKTNPGAYLLQLQDNLKGGKKYFSVQQFLDLLKIPDIFNEAIILAQDYKEKMNFDAPLSVVWVFYVMNDDFTSAEELFQKYPVSLKKVHILVCRKILSSENIRFGKRYLYFINKYEVEPCVKESAYRTLLDLLFYKSMYTDAAKLVQECLGNNIPLKKLNQRTLQMLQEFLAKEAMENGTEQSFTFAIEDIQRSSSDSDDGENFEK
ncbi:uncharacterized protein LOC129222460 [Uloborus diversus]|uniref:uncharacterized protein LOC129222460 n=1 Tax=Uloborus diversus TaxID=327109 RepID=UPI0024090004|nr:uncharacterized protein LOC129222460 [Uloborus diversus]